MDPIDPAPLDLQLVRGLTHDPFVAVFYDNFSNQIDLTGWGVKAYGRKMAGALPILDLGATIMSTGELLGYEGEVDGPGRVKYADFTYQETLNMLIGDLVWDMVLITPDDHRLGTMIAGNISIINIITIF